MCSKRVCHLVLNKAEDEELTGAGVGGVASAETYQHPTSDALPDTLPEHGGDEQLQGISLCTFYKYFHCSYLNKCLVHCILNSYNAPKLFVVL